MNIDKEKYISSGFDDYITKPVERDLLFEKIYHLPQNIIA